MSDARKCETCGASIPEDAPGGACPGCLLGVGLGGDAEPTEPFDREELAEVLPQFEIEAFIGQGGMGVVYRARHKALDRVVALKILTRDVAKDPAFAERFTREARALAALNHPNIVGVHEAGRAGGLWYLTMEYVDGVNLRQAQRAGRLAPAQALAIVPQICDALQYAHDEGVVHRDIKPENILLDRKGHVKIADFGLAKLLRHDPAEPALTGTAQVMGTFHYIAPEQMRTPQEVDHRADIYSLGVVFYEMLTGDLPIGRFPNPSERVEVDVRLDDVVLRTLERERERRYQHVSEVKSSVEQISSASALPSAGKTSVSATADAASRTATIPRPIRVAAACFLAWPVVGFAVLALTGSPAPREDIFWGIACAVIVFVGLVNLARFGARRNPGRLWKTGMVALVVLGMAVVGVCLLALYSDGPDESTGRSEKLTEVHVRARADEFRRQVAAQDGTASRSCRSMSSRDGPGTWAAPRGM